MMAAASFGEEEQPTFESYDTSRGFDNPLYDTSPQVCVRHQMRFCKENEGF